MSIEDNILRRVPLRPPFKAAKVFKPDAFGEYEVRSEEGELLAIFRHPPTDQEVRTAWENSGKPH